LGLLFRENGIDYDKVNYFSEPFTEKNLDALIKKTGRRPFELLRKGVDARLTADTPDANVIKAMVADPNLIQRPIVEVGKKAVLARPIERVLELLAG
jgi:arsenate reductase (glutaredoxin)